MKKKLLVTASTFPRWEGDTEPRFVLDLSKELNKYFDVTVLVPACPETKDNEIMEGIKVSRYHYFPVRRWETLCYPGAIVPRIKEKKIRVLLVPFLFIGLWYKQLKILKNYDLVHAHWIIPQGIVQSFFHKPYLLTGHGGDVLELNKLPFSFLKKRALDKAGAVSVVSKKLKQKLEEKYETQNIRIQSMGCDLKKFGREKRVEGYFGQEEKKIILFVGRLVKIKGIEYLIDAMKNIDAQLIIVGEGPLERELKERAKEIQEKVLFLGGKNHNELPTIYASSDIFVIPSITLEGGITEGTPTVIAEALASGLPIIGTNTGGIPQAIENKKNGFIIPDKDSVAIEEKIKILLSDDEVRQKMSNNALESSKKYGYENIAIQFHEILDSM